MLQKMTIGDLSLQGGGILRNVVVGYTSFGQLNAAGDNAVLVTHGFTSGPGMVLRDEVIAGEGSWADLVGPGAALDTNRFFVVCPNMPGSCYGTTGPASTNPDTGRLYGPTFPEIAVQDMIASQHRLLMKLGITRLRTVVGPSYGGIQAIQWALDHPDLVDSIGVIVSGPFFPSQITVEKLLATLSSDPNWNGGWIYDNGGIFESLRRLRYDTLRGYGMGEVLADQGMDDDACHKAIEQMADTWAREFDPNSLITLCKAGHRFHAHDAIRHIKAKMLWVISSSDNLFPPDAGIEAIVRSVPTHPIYVTIDSRYGHVASGADFRKWENLLREMVDSCAQDLELLSS